MSLHPLLLSHSFHLPITHLDTSLHTLLTTLESETVQALIASESKWKEVATILDRAGEEAEKVEGMVRVYCGQLEVLVLSLWWKPKGRLKKSGDTEHGT